MKVPKKKEEENRIFKPALSLHFQIGAHTFGYADGGGRLWKQAPSGLSVWIGGLYEERAGKTLCHVFAGGKRITTFEPTTGGPYASIFAPKQMWAKASEALSAAASWPLQHGRTPFTVLLVTLFGVLTASITARRGRRWAPSFSVFRWFGTFAALLGAKTWVKMNQARLPTVFDLVPFSHRERRWFVQSVWRQCFSVILIVALVFVTTPTEVEAQIYMPVFYYYHSDHLGSSNVMTDRYGSFVEHYEYNAFGSNKGCTPNPLAFQVSNRYTGQVLDEDTGLYYYNARYYDPELGRFTQADTIVPGAADPQNLNRYSYVNNNPLRYLDPSGHGGLGGLFSAVFKAEARYWTSGSTWENVGIGFALGWWAGAVGAFAVGHASTEIGASIGYFFGSDVGNDAAFAAIIAGTIFLAIYGVSGGFGGTSVSTAQQAIIATSAALSVASASAAYAGDAELSETLGYAALGVSVVGAIAKAYQEPQEQQTSQQDPGTIAVNPSQLESRRSAPAFFMGLTKPIQNQLLNFASKIWALPSTLVGLALGILNIPFGARWYFSEGNIIFWNARAWGNFGTAFGNVHIYGQSSLPSDTLEHLYIKPNPPRVSMGMHESGHTWQQQRLGPFFWPMYPIFRDSFERAAEDFGAGLH